MGGVSRRALERNPNALETVAEWNTANSGPGHVTVPHLADDAFLEDLVDAPSSAYPPAGRKSPVPRFPIFIARDALSPWAFP